MDKKCNGYESQFIFLNEDDFKLHLQSCETCQIEHEKMLKVSQLLQEVKPYFIQNKLSFVKKVAILTLTVLAGVVLQYFTISSGLYDKYISHDTTSIEDLGFPVDDYGF